MIGNVCYFAVSTASVIFVIYEVLQLVPFLSNLGFPENETDVSTFYLFTIDACLIVLFLAQHSSLASVTYRRFMDDLGLSPIARSVYVLLSAAMLKLLMYLWQPIPEVQFWMVDISNSPLLSMFFTIVHIGLWIMLFLQVFTLEPLHFIGFKQAYFHIKYNQGPQSYLGTRLRLLLAKMPHAGAGCFIAILWMQPYMTFDRMMLASVFTAYLCGSFSLSERDYEYVKQCSWTSSTVTTSYHKVK